jgi:hypothetical protein
VISVSARVPREVLLLLRPNTVLDEKFREGYRAAIADERGWKRPRDLHRVGDAVAQVRASVCRAVGALSLRPQPDAQLSLRLLLRADFTCDDDAWLFCLKPALDGLADALGWGKDRRRVGEFSGLVVRDEGDPSLVLQLDEVA